MTDLPSPSFPAPGAAPAARPFPFHRTGHAVAAVATCLTLAASASAESRPLIESFERAERYRANLELRLPEGWSADEAALVLSPVDRAETPPALDSLGDTDGDGLAEWAIHGGRETTEGFYELSATDGGGNHARLGILHWRFDGRSIHFIPSDPDNHAQPPHVARWTDEQKAAQVAAAEALVRRVHDEIKAGRKRIVIEPGHYRFTPELKTLGPGSHAVFALQGLQGVEIDGQGATFWITDPQLRLIALNQCEDVTLRRLMIDYDPLPYVQGRVLEVKTGDDPELTFQVAPGFGTAAQVQQSFKGMTRFHVFKDDDRRGLPLSPTWSAGHDRRGGYLAYDEQTGVARVPLYVAPVSHELDHWGIEPGDLIALTPRDYPQPISARRCGGVTIEELTIYASARFGFLSEFAHGQLEIRRSRLVRRPNTRRLVSSNVDGFHLADSRVGPRLIELEMDGVMDDCIAMPTFNAVVLEQVSSTELIISTRSAGREMPVEEGAGIRALRLGDLATVVDANVVELSKDGEARRIELPEDHPVAWFARGKKLQPYRMVLDQPVEAPPGALIIPDLWQAEGYLVDDCYIFNSWAHAVRATGIDGTIRNSTFDHTRGIGLSLNPRWTIGVPVEGLTIENNVMRDTWSPRRNTAAIVLSVEPFAPDAQPVHRDIRIVGNRFLGTPYAVMLATDTTGLTIEDNLFSGTNREHHVLDPSQPEATTDLNAVIVLKNVDEVQIQGNVYEDVGPHAAQEVVTLPR